MILHEKERLAAVAAAGLRKAGAVVPKFDNVRFPVTFAGSKQVYKVAVCELGEEDPEEPARVPFEGPVRRGQKLDNHFSVLDAALAALHDDPTARANMTDLSTDGDGSDCEAIFHYAGEGWLKLKVT